MNMNLQLFARGTNALGEEIKEKNPKTKTTEGSMKAPNKGSMTAPAMESMTAPNKESTTVSAEAPFSVMGTVVAGQSADQVTGAEQGKALTLEERIAKLEALLENHEGTAHSAQTYEQARKARNAASKEAMVQATFRKLQVQTQEAQKLYPNLDLAREAKDPRFVELLKCGLDVKSAFEVVHKDEIISASMEYAAREVERMLTNKVLASGGRPMENGGIHGPALSKTDPKAMTRQERKDIIRRVFAGEKITF